MFSIAKTPLPGSAGLFFFTLTDNPFGVTLLPGAILGGLFINGHHPGRDPPAKNLIKLILKPEFVYGCQPLAQKSFLYDAYFIGLGSLFCLGLPRFSDALSVGLLIWWIGVGNEYRARQSRGV